MIPTHAVTGATSSRPSAVQRKATAAGSTGTGKKTRRGAVVGCLVVDACCCWSAGAGPANRRNDWDLIKRRQPAEVHGHHRPDPCSTGQAGCPVAGGQVAEAQAQPGPADEGEGDELSEVAVAVVSHLRSHRCVDDGPVAVGSVTRSRAAPASRPH